MEEPLFPDRYDWRGCDVVQFNPEKLGGCATVLNTRMNADGVFINYLSGMSAKEISYSFQSDIHAVRRIIEFALTHKLKPRPQSITGHAEHNGHKLDFVISPWSAGKGLTIRSEWQHEVKLTGAGIWQTVDKAKDIAQQAADKMLCVGCQILWHGRD